MSCEGGREGRREGREAVSAVLLCNEGYCNQRYSLVCVGVRGGGFTKRDAGLVFCSLSRVDDAGLSGFIVYGVVLRCLGWDVRGGEGGWNLTTVFKSCGVSAV